MFEVPVATLGTHLHPTVLLQQANDFTRLQRHLIHPNYRNPTVRNDMRRFWTELVHNAAREPLGGMKGRKPTFTGAYREEEPPGAMIERVKAAFLWEVFFSLNLGCTVVNLIFALSFALAAFFSRLESRIKISLHMRQTDFVVGHLTTWVPTVAIALLIWIVLRKFASAKFTGEFVRWVAGTITVFTPAVSPICYSIASSWAEGWRIGVLLSEMIVAVSLVWWFQSGKSKTSPTTPVLLLATHFAFWRFVPIPDGRVPGEFISDGDIFLLLGFSAAVAWYRYLGWLKRAAPLEPSNAAA